MGDAYRPTLTILILTGFHGVEGVHNVVPNLGNDGEGIRDVMTNFGVVADAGDGVSVRIITMSIGSKGVGVRNVGSGYVCVCCKFGLEAGS